jgi:uncharacterized protein Smg (DUF494 family)
MKQMSDEDAYEQLHEAGFSVLEIYRIIKQRRNYAASKLDQAPPIRMRPRLLRWRVRSRRLTDQVVQENVSYVSPLEKIYILKTVFVSLMLKKLKERKRSLIWTFFDGFMWFWRGG